MYFRGVTHRSAAFLLGICCERHWSPRQKAVGCRTLAVSKGAVFPLHTLVAPKHRSSGEPPSGYALIRARHPNRIALWLQLELKKGRPRDRIEAIRFR
jgi:hypothetical protein